MDFIYVDESGDEFSYPSSTQYFALSAISVPERNWQAFFDAVLRWRQSLRARFGIHVRSELHATKLLRGGGNISSQTVSKAIRARVFREALAVLENEGSGNGVWVTNILMQNSPTSKNYDKALGRLVNRLERTLASKQDSERLGIKNCLVNGTGLTNVQIANSVPKLMDRHERNGIIVFDEGHDTLVRQVSRRLHVYNPVPSRLGVWSGTGQSYKHIPIQRIIADPFMRDSKVDLLVQLADLVVYALRLTAEPPSPRTLKYKNHLAFNILDKVLNRAASRGDPKGIVRS